MRSLPDIASVALRIVWTLVGVAVIALLTPHVYLTWQHATGWYNDADQFAAQTRMSSVNAQKTTANAEAISARALVLVKSVRAESLNAVLRNLQTVTANAAAVSGDVKFFTGDIRDNWDIIKEGAILSWGHANDTLGHVDKATLAEQLQQKQIADASLENLQEMKKVIADPNIKLAISHVAGATSDVHVITSHYRVMVTRVKKWWEHITGPIEQFGALVGAKLVTP